MAMLIRTRCYRSHENDYITIDEGLLHDVDKAVDELDTNRSAFIRDTLRMVLRQMDLHKLEEQHAAGYERYPVEVGEFDGWESASSLSSV